MTNPYVLLVQVRDARDAMIVHERECIERRLAGRTLSWRVENALERSADLGWLDGVDALIIGGSGDHSVHHPASQAWVAPLRRLLDRALERGLPGFGICFGHQLLGLHFGAPVLSDEERAEIGTIDVELTPEGRSDALFAGFEPQFPVHTGHSDHVARTPRGLTPLAKSDRLATQVFRVETQPFYTTQFHPELTGAEALARYLAYRTSFERALSEEAAAGASRFKPGADAAAFMLGSFFDLVFDEPTTLQPNETVV
jgi:GMP synthase (glutamine-hydrolysing)